MSGAWARWVTLRKQVLWSSLALLGLGLAIAITRIWIPEVSIAGAVMLVSGFWGITLHNLLGEVVRLQAALDMKRMAMGQPPQTGQVVNLNAGDTLTVSNTGFGAVIAYEARTACSLERIA